MIFSSVSLGIVYLYLTIPESIIRYYHGFMALDDSIMKIPVLIQEMNLGGLNYLFSTITCEAKIHIFI